MPLRALARAMAVGLAAFPVLCPERSLAEIADAGKFSQQLVTLSDKIVVTACCHSRLHLFPNKGNRYRGEGMTFLKYSKS